MTPTYHCIYAVPNLVSMVKYFSEFCELHRTHEIFCHKITLQQLIVEELTMNHKDHEK